MNTTLDNALCRLNDAATFSFRQRLAVRLCLIVPRWHRELERTLTEAATKAGAIDPQASKGGAFQGNWEEVFDWIWEHRQEILEFVMTIISLF